MIQSKKLNKNKQLIILWALLVVLVVAAVAAVAVKYNPIKKAQDIIISGLLTLTDDYDKYKDDRNAMLRSINSDFKFSYSGDPVSKAYTQLYNSYKDFANELLKKDGYKYSAKTYIAYGSFQQYFLEEGMTYIIILIALSVVLVILSVLYLLDKKTALSIQDNTIIGKKSNGKTVQFLLKDIKSVETTSTKGIKITGAGIKYTIHLLQNGTEIKDAIMNLLATLPQDQPVADGSMANKMKEYKELLDSGIITQEEFDAKKKQLLGL